MKTTPRSQLLLVELICDLVIFAVCAVVCVALLVQARVMSLESTDLTHAVYIAQSAAEEGRTEGFAQDGYQVSVLHTASADTEDARIIEVRREDRLIYTLTVGGA